MGMKIMMIGTYPLEPGVVVVVVLSDVPVAPVVPLSVVPLMLPGGGLSSGAVTPCGSGCANYMANG